jgi:hypothetical protein
MARSGTISRSSKSRIETDFCPSALAISPRSCSTDMMTAVDERTNPPRR